MQAFSSSETLWTSPSDAKSVEALRLCVHRMEHTGRISQHVPAPVIDIICSFLRFSEPQNNQVFVVGGRNLASGPLQSAFMLDTWGGLQGNFVWRRLPDMMDKRAGCTAIPILDGKEVLVSGGYDQRGIVDGLLSSVEIYRPGSLGCDDVVSSSPSPKFYSPLPLLHFEKDQSQQQQQSPQRMRELPTCHTKLAGGWTAGPSLLRARWGHASACVRGKAIIAGGCALLPGAPNNPEFMATLTDCEVLDVSGGVGEHDQQQQWKPLAPLNIARSGARAAVSADRYVVIAGGCDDVFGSPETLVSVEVLDLCMEIPTWQLLDTGRLRVPRTTAAIAAFPGGCGDLLVFGGSPSLSSGEILRRNQRQEQHSWVSETLDGAASPTDSAYSDDDAYAPALERGRMGAQAAGIELIPGGSRKKHGTGCIGAMVVVLGGESGAQVDEDGDMVMESSRQLTCVESFVPSGQYYRRLPPKTVPDLPEPRTAMGCCVASGWVNFEFNLPLPPQSDVERAGS